MYFKANSNAIKFRYIPLAFLNLLQELFNGFLATESNTRLINEVIKSCIDSEIFIATALQATDSVSEEEEEDKKKVKENFKKELA